MIKYRILTLKSSNLNTNTEELSETAILHLLRKGNELAFFELYRKYHAQLFSYAVKFLHSEELAKDVVHDVFIKLWENRTELPAVASLQSYLYAICKNAILNMISRATRENRIREEIGKQMMSTEPSVEKVFLSNEQREIVKQVINQLPPKRREVFLLCRMEGKSYEETAKILDISASTVNDHLVKAIKTLKSHLQQYPDIYLALIIVVTVA